ncbi:MAG: hypothetical protein K2H70_04175, partial [Bacteroidales bacterium]|nr:hypothetical protein [Bacteroidales bacterium]
KQLEDQITGLKNKVTESEARIESLQEELALLKDAYAALQAINDSLQVEIVRYQREIAGKDAELASKNSELAAKDSEIAALNGLVSTAFYFVGTAKDIKAKNIFDKKSINPNVKISNFTRIENFNEMNIIETKSSKVTVMSVHPTNSYKINSKNPKNVVIEITDPAKFWSITRFCIIQKK